MCTAHKILLVDDDLGDTELTSEYLQASSPNIELFAVQDGVEALRFLRREGEFDEAFRPDLILLDLNMPRKDGRELLHDIRQDPALDLIPVVVFTSSDAPEDVRRVYRSGGNAYVTKPASLTDFAATIQSIKNFWLDVAQLPQDKSS